MAQDFLNGREFSVPAVGEDYTLVKEGPGTQALVQSFPIGPTRGLEIHFRPIDSEKNLIRVRVIGDSITVDKTRDMPLGEDEYPRDLEKGERWGSVFTINASTPVATIKDAALAAMLQNALRVDPSTAVVDADGCYEFPPEQYKNSIVPLLKTAVAKAEAQSKGVAKEIADQDCGPQSGLPAEVRKEVCAVEGKSR